MTAILHQKCLSKSLSAIYVLYLIFISHYPGLIVLIAQNWKFAFHLVNFDMWQYTTGIIVAQPSSMTHIGVAWDSAVSDGGDS